MIIELIPKLLKVGDIVTITAGKKNHDCGKDHFSDGTTATILDFPEIIYYGRINNFGIKPGVYTKCVSVNLRLEDGSEYAELCSNLKLTDESEYKKRVAKYRSHLPRKHTAWWEQRKNKESSLKFIKKLPYTPFWEGDFVRVRGHLSVARARDNTASDCAHDIFQIIGIDYHDLTKRTRTGDKYPVYRLANKLGARWHTRTGECRIVLIERGPVWKYYHHQSIVFADIEEEAQFYEFLGHTKDICNPSNGLSDWTVEEAIAAIRDGIAHSIAVSRGPIGGKPSIKVKYFADNDLGKRIALATLTGFELAPA